MGTGDTVDGHSPGTSGTEDTHQVQKICSHGRRVGAGLGHVLNKTGSPTGSNNSVSAPPSLFK